MQMNISRQFKTGEIIPEGTGWDRVLVFANGIIREGDTVCIWFDDDSLISGRLDLITTVEMIIRQYGSNREVKYSHIAYIAKKDNGKWKLMREDKT